MCEIENLKVTATPHKGQRTHEHYGYCHDKDHSCVGQKYSTGSLLGFWARPCEKNDLSNQYVALTGGASEKKIGD